MKSAGSQLRELMKDSTVIVAPGAYDAMSAKLIEQTGFPAVYAGSLAVCASLGFPDSGLLSPPELIAHMQRIADNVDIPLIADLDDGGGSPLRIRRNVRLAESAGFAAVQIEDTDLSGGKHLPGSKERVQDLSKAVANIRAAVDARRGDMLIIGRTDAYECEPLQEAVERARAYAEAGADILFLTYVPIAELRTVIHQLPRPLFGTMRNQPWADRSKPISPPPTDFKIRTYPSTALFAAIKSISDLLIELKRSGRNLLVEGDVNVYEILDRTLQTADWLSFLREHQ